MKTAQFIRKLNWLSDARLYELSEAVPYDYGKRARKTRYVIVSKEETQLCSIADKLDEHGRRMIRLLAEFIVLQEKKETPND